MQQRCGQLISSSHPLRSLCSVNHCSKGHTNTGRCWRCRFAHRTYAAQRQRSPLQIGPRAGELQLCSPEELV